MFESILNPIAKLSSKINLFCDKWIYDNKLCKIPKKYFNQILEVSASITNILYLLAMVIGGLEITIFALDYTNLLSKYHTLEQFGIFSAWTIVVCLITILALLPFQMLLFTYIDETKFLN